MKLCIIGSTGHINYALNGLKQLSDMQVVGVAPGSPGESMEKVMQGLAKQDVRPPLYDSYLELLDREQPDVAVIACYMGDTAKVTQEALQRGIHVFAEKPLATTWDDFEKIREAYIKSGVHLAAMLALRYSPAFLTGWEAVRSGAIGTIRTLHAQKSYRLGTRVAPFLNRQTYGGTIPWVGSHAIDWIAWYSAQRFQTVYSAHSTMHNRNHGDLELTAMCLFTLSNEVTATASIDYLRPEQAPSHGDDRIRIAGTEGVLEVRDDRVQLIQNSKPGIQELQLLPKREIFTDFVQQIRGNGKCLVSAEDSFYTTEACLRAQQSADSRQVVNF